jgi:hypothetical protein
MTWLFALFLALSGADPQACDEHDLPDWACDAAEDAGNDQASSWSIWPHISNGF